MVGDRSCSPTCWLEDDDALFLCSQSRCKRAFGILEEAQEVLYSIVTVSAISAPIFGRAARAVEKSIYVTKSSIRGSELVNSMQRAPVEEKKKGGQPEMIEVMKEGKRKAWGWKRRQDAVSLT